MKKSLTTIISVIMITMLLLTFNAYAKDEIIFRTNNVLLRKVSDEMSDEAFYAIMIQSIDKEDYIIVDINRNSTIFVPKNTLNTKIEQDSWTGKLQNVCKVIYRFDKNQPSTTSEPVSDNAVSLNGWGYDNFVDSLKKSNILLVKPELYNTEKISKFNLAGFTKAYAVLVKENPQMATIELLKSENERIEKRMVEFIKGESLKKFKEKIAIYTDQLINYGKCDELVIHNGDVGDALFTWANRNKALNCKLTGKGMAGGNPANFYELTFK